MERCYPHFFLFSYIYLLGFFLLSQQINMKMKKCDTAPDAWVCLETDVFSFLHLQAVGSWGLKTRHSCDQEHPQAWR